MFFKNFLQNFWSAKRKPREVKGPFGGGNLLAKSSRADRNWTKGTKRHRQLYFLPCWQRDGHKDRLAYLAHHTG